MPPPAFNGHCQDRSKVRFYEFEAKRVLAKHGITVPKGGPAQTSAEAEKLATELGCPVVLKPQLLFGAIAPSDAIRRASTPADASKQAQEILKLSIAGRTPYRVLVEQQPAVSKEYSVAVTYDGVRKLPVMMMASDLGGRSIDDVSHSEPARVERRHFSALMPWADYRAKELVQSLGVKGPELTRLTGIVSRLAQLFLQYDLTQADIRSLGRLEDGSFVALDCFMDMEIEGRRRQKPILDELGIAASDPRTPRDSTAFEVEAARIDKDDPRGVAGPVVEFDGNIGLVIGAGGGSLTTFDAVKKHGGRPANYAALGGNPSVKKAQALTKLVLSKPGVEKIAVISNVVSNTRADLVARGVIKGVLELGFEPAEKITVFRVPGAWEADAIKILRKYKVEFCDRSVSISEAARRAVEKIGR